MTASIYYIATSNYKQGFEQFRTDLHYFLPDVQKTVVVLSDGLTEWDNVEENGILYKVYKIKHYCWPIITLFKMQYMLDYKMDTDLVFFVNADLQYNKDYTGQFNLNKLITINSKYEFGKIIEARTPKNSKAYIKDKFKYKIAGFFGGPASIVYKMCEDVCKWVKEDLAYNIIPAWHDQSYLNKWCIENPDLFNDEELLLFNYKSSKCPWTKLETFKKDRYDIRNT